MRAILATLLLTGCATMSYHPLHLSERGGMQYGVDSRDPAEVRRYAEFLCRDRVESTYIFSVSSTVTCMPRETAP